VWSLSNCWDRRLSRCCHWQSDGNSTINSRSSAASTKNDRTCCHLVDTRQSSIRSLYVSCVHFSFCVQKNRKGRGTKLPLRFFYTQKEKRNPLTCPWLDSRIDHCALWPVNHAGPDSAVPNFLADILHRKWNADDHRFLKEKGPWSDHCFGNNASPSKFTRRETMWLEK
jgi:hypothetical protein